MSMWRRPLRSPRTTAVLTTPVSSGCPTQREPHKHRIKLPEIHVEIGFRSPVKQIWWVFDDHLEIIVHTSPLKRGYSLESPHRSNSNEYPQHVFLWRTVGNYPVLIIKYSLFLFHCRRKDLWSAMWYIAKNDLNSEEQNSQNFVSTTHHYIINH